MSLSFVSTGNDRGKQETGSQDFSPAHSIILTLHGMRRANSSFYLPRKPNRRSFAGVNVETKEVDTRRREHSNGLEPAVTCKKRGSQVHTDTAAPLKQQCLATSRRKKLFKKPFILSLSHTVQIHGDRRYIVKNLSILTPPPSMEASTQPPRYTNRTGFVSHTGHARTG